jgi:hypothetical protein
VEFVRHLMRNNLPARHLIASDFILANEVVAGYYGFGEKTEAGFEFVPIRPGRGWAASSPRRRSWPGCPTGGSRTR